MSKARINFRNRSEVNPVELAVELDKLYAKIDQLETILEGKRGDVILGDDDALRSQYFRDGFLGKGMKLWKSGPYWRLAVDDILVRRSFAAFEFVVQQVKAHNGSLIITDTGSGKVFKGKVIT